jgi:hypothetical protein
MFAVALICYLYFIYDNLSTLAVIVTKLNQEEQVGAPRFGVCKDNVVLVIM